MDRQPRCRIACSVEDGSDKAATVSSVGVLRAELRRGSQGGLRNVEHCTGAYWQPGFASARSVTAR